MAEYRVARRIVIPAGTILTYPAPPQKEAVTYAHAVLDADATEPLNVACHWSVPLDAALKAGVVEEIA